MLTSNYSALFAIEDLQQHQHDVMALLLQRLRQPANIVALALDNTLQTDGSSEFSPSLWSKKATTGMHEILQCFDTIQHAFELDKNPAPVDLNSVIDSVFDMADATLRQHDIELEFCGKTIAATERLNITRHAMRSSDQKCDVLARKKYLLADAPKLFHATLGILAWLTGLVAALKDRQPDLIPKLCFRVAAQADAVRIEVVAQSVAINDSDSRARLLRCLLRQAVEGAELTYELDTIGASVSLALVLPLLRMEQIG